MPEFTPDAALQPDPCDVFLTRGTSLVSNDMTPWWYNNMPSTGLPGTDKAPGDLRHGDGRTRPN